MAASSIRDPANQLVSQQKTVTEPLHNTPDQAYRFRHSPQTRSHWLRLMPLIEPHYRKVGRYQNCGTDAYVEYSPSLDDFRLRANHCGNRICPACQRHYAARVARRLTDLFTHSRSHPPLFITLTLRPSGGELGDVIRHLKAFFRRLRSTKLWKQAVDYGVAIVEVTRGRHRDHWHAHLHVIAWSRYLDARKLSAVWRAVTNGSYIVQVQRVKSSDDVGHYVSVYLTKSPDEAVMADDALSHEWYRAVTAQHWVIRFGHRKLIPPRTEPQRATDWYRVCSLQDVIRHKTSESLKALARILMNTRGHTEYEETIANVIETVDTT